jgi:peptidoglycan/xylan/chitin deacetylase (PgdA/CDA1 family)
MANIGFFNGVLGRCSGFVFAFHDTPPGKLEEFVEGIRPARPVHLSELVERSKHRKSTCRLFAITVDDGVGENVRNLARLFSAKSWPATFYLPTQYLDTAEGMVFQWWSRVKPLLPSRRVRLSSGVLDLTSPEAVEDLSRNMERAWHSQRLESYLPLTMELVEIVLRENGLTRTTLQPPLPITWREVEELGRSELIRFESHGVSHAAMSTLTDEELAFEMKTSRDLVAEHTGLPCRHLAYPFGNPLSIGERAAAMAERFYDSAVTMTRGHVDSANPWLLPRIPLYPKNSNLVARLKIFLSVAGSVPGIRTTPLHERARH